MNKSRALLRVYLFGHFSAERGGQPIVGLEARRLQDVFSYLLLNRHRRCSRKSLASLFWGESSIEQAKRNLRQVLWQLQAALEVEKDTVTESIIQCTGDWLQINPHAALWLDVDCFEQAWSKTRLLPGKDLDAAQVQLLRNATELHRDILLPENYDDWCLRERERLLSMYITQLENLMEYSETHHDFEAALSSGFRILAYDQTREKTHQQLMLLYYFSGKRVEALKQYQRCEAALLEAFGAPPSKSTQALYQRIFLDQLEGETQSGTMAGNLQEETSLLAHILSDLQQVHSIQTYAQRQIDARIQKIQQALSLFAGASEQANKSRISFEKETFLSKRP